MHFTTQQDYTAYLTEGDKPLENLKVIKKEEQVEEKVSEKKETKKPEQKKTPSKKSADKKKETK